MLSMRMIAIAACAVLFSVSSASAQKAPTWKHRTATRREVVEYRMDRRDLRRDVADARRDRRFGTRRELQSDVREIKADRRELRRDRWRLNH